MAGFVFFAMSSKSKCTTQHEHIELPCGFALDACVFLFVLDPPGASTRCLGLQIHALHYSFDLRGSCVTICPPLTCYR